MCDRMAKMLHFHYNSNLFLFFPPSRVYRACLQRTSVFSLLTGALLEAVAALGARSTLLYPFPQGTGHNNHAVLKGAENVLFICVFDHERHKEGESRKKCRGHHVFDSEKKSFSLLPLVHHSFPVLLSHVVFLSTVVFLGQ